MMSAVTNTLVKPIPVDNYGNLEPSGEWRRNLDLKGWAEEVRALEKKLKKNQTDQDDV